MEFDKVRYEAATAVFNLALKKEAKAVHRNLSKPPKKGMVKGEDDSGTYHFPELLKEVVQLLDIALGIWEDPTGLNLKAMHSEMLGEHQIAAQCYDRILAITKDREGYTAYQKVAAEGKSRCLKKCP